MALKDDYGSGPGGSGPGGSGPGGSGPGGLGGPGPPAAPGLGRWQRRVGATQTLLLLLVSASLCGLVIEGCFIYRLMHPAPASSSSSSSSSSELLAGPEVTSPPDDHHHDVLPSRPVAHLTDGQDVVHGPQVLSWSVRSEPLLHGMRYGAGRLQVQTEGFYYVYSKLFFSDGSIFHHSVDLRTAKYTGGGVTLLQARKYSSGAGRTRSNSFLGGVFHLDAGDALYVRVSNTSKVERHAASENVFGAFMI